jgi:hydroxymethylglutaryl-CoA lyase
MIRIFEVGPRDGLQNESRVLKTDEKLTLIGKLLDAGLDQIEVGSFVRPDRVPQMAGTEEIYLSERMQNWQQTHPDVKFWSLVPNDKGLMRAEECGARHIAVFGGATESFVQKNIGMSIAESLNVFADVVRSAVQKRMKVRGYISVCWVCPYEGVVDPGAVKRVVQSMLDMGIEEISLGDTVGRAHPEATERLLTELLRIVPSEKLAVHFHDTYGMAIANIDRSIKMGISVVDSSIGGLGGCPYAAGATGNVATEDVYTLLQEYESPRLKLDALLDAAGYALSLVGKTGTSKRLAAGE